MQSWRISFIAAANDTEMQQHTLFLSLAALHKKPQVSAPQY